MRRTSLLCSVGYFNLHFFILSLVLLIWTLLGLDRDYRCFWYWGWMFSCWFSPAMKYFFFLYLYEGISWLKGRHDWRNPMERLHHYWVWKWGFSLHILVQYHLFPDRGCTPGDNYFKCPPYDNTWNVFLHVTNHWKVSWRFFFFISTIFYFCHLKPCHLRVVHD